MVLTNAFRRPRLGAAFAATAAAGLVLTACGGVQTSTGSGTGTGTGNYPSGTVEMYVGASPGGSSDLISRAVSKGLSDDLKASFPVINREGANGALAAAEVAKAKPDGSTIAIQNASLFAITPLAVSADEVTKIDDFDVVYGVSRDDYVLVTNPASGYKTLKDLEVTQYLFMTVPKGTPQEVKDKLTEGMKATFKTDAYKSFNEQNSLTPLEEPGDQVLAQLQADSKRYADLVKQYGINLRDKA